MSDETNTAPPTNGTSGEISTVGPASRIGAHFANSEAGRVQPRRALHYNQGHQQAADKAIANLIFQDLTPTKPPIWQ